MLPKMIFRILQMAEMKLQIARLELAIATEAHYEVKELNHV